MAEGLGELFGGWHCWKTEAKEEGKDMMTVWSLDGVTTDDVNDLNK